MLSFHLLAFSQKIKDQDRVWVPGKMGEGFLFMEGREEGREEGR